MKLKIFLYGLILLSLVGSTNQVFAKNTMKTIGLLGGTGWSSTISYYSLLNEMVNQKLGGYHSAKIILKSIDYHDIMSNYGKDYTKIAELLHQELTELIGLKPDCIIICCNSLHKYYDIIKDSLKCPVPVFHAVDLVAQKCKQKQYKTVLLLATKFTMEDGFFAKVLENFGIAVLIPQKEERDQIDLIHKQLMNNKATDEAQTYFQKLIESYTMADAVVLGCTEFPLVAKQETIKIPLLNPMELQVERALEYALE
ncbi:MAG: aspartate/glutamate racemase family protein [Candidatus Babeliales bacterium]